MKYGLSGEELDTIRAYLARQPGIRQAVLFGSRALGTFKEASDIDIALKGEGLDIFTCGSLKSRLEDETTIPYFFDFVAYDTLTNEALRRHIDTHGVCIYRSATGRGETEQGHCRESGEGEGMSEWREISLGDVCDIYDGPHATPPKLERGYVFLGISSLGFDGRIDPAHLEFVSEESFRQWTRRIKPHVNDIVFSYETKLGVAAIIPKDFECCLGRRMGLLRPKENVDPRFLLHAYLAPAFQKTIHERTIHGSTVDRIPLKAMSGFPISLPDLHEQKAIAAVLSSLDDKIDLLHRQNQTLEAMAETLFRQWFVEGAGEDWEAGVISDLIEFNPQRKLVKGTIAPYLDMASLSTTTFNPEGWYNREFSSGTKFMNGDTLLARITPCLENGKTAFVTILDKNQVGWGSTEFIVMRPKTKLHPFFAYTLARNGDFREFAEGCLAGSSGRQRVETSHLTSYPIKMPAEDIIREFNAIAESIVPKLHSNAAQIRTLETLRDTLLPKLMSGEVRVAT